MEEGDHSDCPVELLVCPEHRDELLRVLNEAGAAESSSDDEEGDPVQFTDPAGKPILGWCLWCNQGLYTSEELWGHSDNGVEGCPVLKAFISEQASTNATDIEGGI